MLEKTPTYMTRCVCTCTLVLFPSSPRAIHPQSTVAEKIAADILGNAVPPPGYHTTGYADSLALGESRKACSTTASL